MIPKCKGLADQRTRDGPLRGQLPSDSYKRASPYGVAAVLSHIDGHESVLKSLLVQHASAFL
ncbi:Protein of unknown function [Gryllus bimaculatus]|nr:Protein of unknown function [Gryllus bimaculatus]